MEVPVGHENEQASASPVTAKPVTITPVPEPDTKEGFSPAAFLLGFSVYLVIGLAVAWNTEAGQAFLERFCWAVLMGFVVVAAAVGDPAVFVSVGAMHQGPHGGGPVIAIVDVGE